ncbi:hypothetical protein GJR96_02790 [Haloferax sp. MBLA0076]|uniref:Uncharacterized protein n=1 Tax=Haloferax litoreum TaxID=2666140 RepID=A0A6A8GDD7_9EURY|nr:MULTISPECIES: hypothetical protein [Haloferax]KAB1192424.1 hypothetical protein Hfx1148_02775 [Haloferax sp. CBA1148]MRX20891.1 hypothetical protein [Haloferax litoreum]
MRQNAKPASQKLVKPNCTITLRHSKILDQMASNYYVSRSEALRACITDHERTLDGDSEDSIKLLHKKVDSQSEKLHELSGIIESLLSVIVGPQLPLKHSTQLETGSDGSLPRIPLTESAPKPESGANEKTAIDNDTYDSIKHLKKATLSEISDHCGRIESEVRDSVGRLDSRFLVTSIVNDGITEYQLRAGTSNGEDMSGEA